MNEKLPELRKKAMSLPLTPGVYIMKNKEGEIIYIGKAKALKNRVSQYFGSQNTHSVKVRKMVENVRDFDYILCDSEFEALVLECSLIKQNQPKYNILLKDDKGYSYIKVNNTLWKSLEAVHQKNDDDAQYIGPYMSMAGVNEILDEASKIFKLPTCGKIFPRDKGSSRPCLNYHLGLCSAPCAGKISVYEHNAAVDEAVSYITGGKEKLVEDLKKQMAVFAENEEFEKAARCRDKLKSISRLNDKQKVFSYTVEQQDAFALVNADDGDGGKLCFSVLRYRSSRLYDSDCFIIDNPGDLPFARGQILKSYYQSRDFVPSKIICDGEVEDKELICRWLSERAGKKVNICVPQKGAQMALIDMCRRNAAQKLGLYLGRGGKETGALDELAKLLGLSKPPQYIESYDISHTAGSDNVAGMVVFKNGAPCKKMYRRFSIKGFGGQDDYSSLAQTLERRFNEYKKAIEEGQGPQENSFAVLPDLILLDGGKGQVNAVRPVLEGLGINVPLFGMVKDNHHKTRAIVNETAEITISSKRSAFTLVSSIQEEVHRFSVAYHHKKHKNSVFSSQITKIDGVGEKTAKNILAHFKTIQAFKNADKNELMKIDGIGERMAEKILKALEEF